MNHRNFGRFGRFGGKETGVALFISLVLLLALTIVGVSSVQTTSLEVRMTRNEHDATLAFQAAESALRDAEEDLEAMASTAGFSDAGAGGLYNVARLGDPEHWEDSDVWSGDRSIPLPGRPAQREAHACR